jgi:hypothetical protein
MNISPPASGSMCKLAACFMPVSGLAYSLALRMKAISSSKMLLSFTALHGIISQKTELFTERNISNASVIRNLKIIE